MEYNFRETEQKWQQYWAEKKTFRAENNSSKPKYYVLDMFPYPSGAGLHVGHPLGYIASDIVARFKRLKGFNVLHPMGYDSFGLPAEQYAIQTGQHPAITTENNIARYRDQLDKIGFSFDWDREVRTSDPKYYKWTQWIFIQLFHSWYNPQTDKAELIENLISIFEKRGCNFSDEPLTGNIEHDLLPFSADEWKAMNEKEKQNVLMHFRLAYLSEAMVNWCPQLGTVLANEEVKDGVSERGGYPVERKLMPQWSLRITAYAERLLNDLEKIEWSESLKESQRNWIGKSEGSSLKFRVSHPELVSGSHEILKQVQDDIEVFTTRPDTVFGVTFMTLSPEHELIEKITTAENKKAVDEYVTAAKNRSERERMAEVKNVSGVFTGAYAIHPFSGKQIPIWIGDYVLAGYGTGAVMGVPAHDTRDFAFAKHFNLEIIKVIEPNDKELAKEECFDTYDGYAINSDFINNLQVKDAIKKIISEIEKRGLGKGKTNYRLRDANFGRQRYWGEPIPIYYKDGIPHTMPESDLPLVLPEVDKYLPTETGEPPLARAKDWTYTPHLNPPRGGGLDEPFRLKKREEGAVPEHQTADKKFYPEIKNSSGENRKNPTEAEETLWKYLKNEQTGYKIRRQHIIDVYIADFVCLDKKVVIEVDGKHHDQHKDEDAARTEMLNVKGFSVIRFTNEEVIANPEKIQQQIKKYLDEKDLTEEGAAASLPSGEGRGGAYSSEAYPLETTTMPGWAGSSWYYLRYMDAHNEKEFASLKAINYWQNVDLYIGGSEHATGHLLYVRFWTKFLNDSGYIPVIEPAKKLINQGMIQGMSEKIFSSKNISEFGGERNENNSTIYWNFKTNIQSIDEIIQSHVKKYGYPEIPFNKIYVEREQMFRMVIYVSADLIENDSDFIEHNVNIALCENSKLNFEKYIESNRDNRVQVFITKNGLFIVSDFLESKPYPLNKNEACVFLTKPEVEKMSKSKLNVVTPDDIVNDFGADCLRLYEMFLGPLEQSKPWNTNGISGVSNFIRKLWRLYHSGANAPATLPTGEGQGGAFNILNEPATKAELKTLHKTIKKVTEDIERYSFNTSVSNFMICVNELTDLKCNKREILEPLTILISPYAPHIAEMLWAKLKYGNDFDLNNIPEDYKSVTFAQFPEFKEEYLVEDSFEYPVSINGKTRFKIPLSLQLTKEQIEKEVLSADELKKYLDGNAPKKIIVVPGRIVNVVI